MTEQEIDKLREKLAPEYSVKRQNGAITVELVKVRNRVLVEPINCSISTPDYRINAFHQSFDPQEMSFSFSVQGIVVGIKHTKEIANHLAKCLEDYLNKS